MRLSPATNLSDRQIVWVSYRNDGTSWNENPDMVYPSGRLATTWAGLFADVYDGDVRTLNLG